MASRKRSLNLGPLSTNIGEEQRRGVDKARQTTTAPRSLGEIASASTIVCSASEGRSAKYKASAFSPRENRACQAFGTVPDSLVIPSSMHEIPSAVSPKALRAQPWQNRSYGQPKSQIVVVCEFDHSDCQGVRPLKRCAQNKRERLN